MRGKPLVYLDSANTSQKPESVIRAMDDYYRHANANIHRATHLLSERATAVVRRHAREGSAVHQRPEPRSIVLTTGTTDGINLVAQTYGRMMLKPGDEVLLSWLEHHSNIVPWQILCEQTGAVLRVAPINDRGEIDLDAYERAALEAHAHRRGQPRVQRAGHHQPRARHHRPCPRCAVRWC